jgi:hypothetical protein
MERLRSGGTAGTVNVESREFAAFRRVASKGVYTGGGSIAEAVEKRKLRGGMRALRSR